jgi:hypothetical protein
MRINLKISSVMVVAFILMPFTSTSFSQGKEDQKGNVMQSYMPENGFVPTEQVAAKVAEVILIPIYGEENIKNQKPFTVSLVDDVWVVKGSLPKDQLGGEFIIKLAKRDGRILQVSHSK